MAQAFGTVPTHTRRTPACDAHADLPVCPRAVCEAVRSRWLTRLSFDARKGSTLTTLAFRQSLKTKAQYALLRGG